METFTSSQCCPLQGCQVGSSPTCVRMDAWGRITRVYGKEPGCELNETGKLSSACSGCNLTSPQLIGIAEGLTYLHSCNVVHGDLKGVRCFAYPRSFSSLMDTTSAEHNDRRIRQPTNHGFWPGLYRPKSPLEREHARWR